MKMTAIEIIYPGVAYTAEIISENDFKLKIHSKKSGNYKLFCLKNALFLYISSTSALLLYCI
jgi:hypothetical protein